MLKKGLIQQKKNPINGIWWKIKPEWTIAREWGASDSPATFSYADLLKLVKKTDNN